MTFNIKKSNFFIALVVVLALGAGAYFLFSKNTPHGPLRTYAAWWINPAIQKDTHSLVYRFDYDTLPPYKAWSPRYYVPVRRYDSTHKASSPATAKDSLAEIVRYLYRDSAYIIHDYDKHYAP